MSLSKSADHMDVHRPDKQIAHCEERIAYHKKAIEQTKELIKCLQQNIDVLNGIMMSKTEKQEHENGMSSLKEGIVRFQQSIQEHEHHIASFQQQIVECVEQKLASSTITISPFTPFTTFQSPAMYYEEQKNCAHEIVTIFKKGLRHVMLASSMQAGKAGAFNRVLAQMLEFQMIQRVFVLCGSQDILLEDQLKDEITKYNIKYYNRLTEIVIVKFRQEFKQIYDVDVRNSLIIIDESHVDQSNRQQLDLLLKNWKCSSILDGSEESHTILQSLNSYVLTVSATSFSEMANCLNAIKGGYRIYKTVVGLTPGQSYRGVEYYRQNQLIHKYFDILNHWEAFMEIIQRHGNKYHILRIKKNYDAIKEQCHLNGLKVYEYNNQIKTIGITKDELSLEKNKKKRIYRGITKTLESKPKQPSIILIKETLRVGKVLPKEHIGTVWETACNSNIDTVLQSLLGRCCGYHTHNIEIYINEQCFRKDNLNYDQLERYVECMKIVYHLNQLRSLNPLKQQATLEELIDYENELMKHITIMPTTGTNLHSLHKRHYQKNNNGLTKSIPYKIHIDVENYNKTEEYDQLADALISDRDEVTKLMVIDAFLSNMDSHMDNLKNALYLTEEQLMEINQFITDYCNGQDDIIHLRHVSHNQYNDNTITSLVRACENKEHCSIECTTRNNRNEPRTNNAITVYIVYSNCNEEIRSKGGRPGDLYFIFQTVAPSARLTTEQLQTIHIDQRIPQTKGKEIYYNPNPITEITTTTTTSTSTTTTPMPEPEMSEKRNKRVKRTPTPEDEETSSIISSSSSSSSISYIEL